MSDAPTMSYANRASNLEKSQAMPMAARQAQPKQKPAPAPTQPPTQQPKQAPAPAPAPAAQARQPVAATPTSLPAPSVKIIKAAKAGQATVKAVTSGDTIVVQGNPNGDVPAPEKTIVISGIIAPKFGKGKSQVDEPFAWESREYLRKRVIGQAIHFDINYTHADSGREYATVTYEGSSLSIEILSAGWAKVKVGKDGTTKNVSEELLSAQSEAESLGRGIHQKGANPAHHVRSINFTPDVRAFYDKFKGRPLPGVIDGVRDGSTLRIEIPSVDEPLKHTMIILHLAGVQCPKTPMPLSVLQQQYERKLTEDPKSKAVKPVEETAAPFALEAQQFTEDRLLNRDVQVVLQGVDKMNNLFGSIVFAKGNITQLLLKQGYGSLVPWSAALTNEAEKYKAAEASAKTGHLRIWYDYADDGNAQAPRNRVFDAKVLQVVSGDQVVVVDSEGNEHRISLASIKAPRLGRRGEKDEPYALEAKEHIRSKLIGHKVKVIVEYVRSAPPKSADTTSRVHATLFQGKLNVNDSLVAAGLAEVIRHRVDEERSQFYDTYLSSEQKAKEGKAKPPSKSMVDLTDRPRPPRKIKKSEDAEAEEAEDESEKKVDPREEEKVRLGKALSLKVKTFFSLFQRDQNVIAVVEYVFSGSRFKLSVPKENVLIAFALSGLRTPNPKTDDGKDNPLYATALQFVRSRIMQHTVRIEVEALDKGDNFLGQLYIGKQNLGVELLKEGLAEIQEFSARKSNSYSELTAAQLEAQNAKKGKWVNYVKGENDEKVATPAQEFTEPESREFVSVRVTDVEDANDFYIHYVSDSNIELVESSLRSFADNVPDDVYTPSKGSSMICAGQFNDGNWYRVRIESLTTSGTYRVFFLDYGNHDELDADKLRALPSELQKIPPLAHRATLAGVKAPHSEDYAESAAFAFNDMVWGQDLVGKVETTDFSKIAHVTLMHESSPVSINKQLLRDGWARVQTRAVGKLKALVDELKECESFARKNHYNIWEYGDVSDEEEDKTRR